jgi:uncharacterized protein (TIGR02996 family)
MTSERDFIAMIIANPDDSGPRLVYADWLDDHGRYADALALRSANYGKIEVESDLLGKIIVAIAGCKGEDEMILTLLTGEKYRLYHRQECCESVSVEEIIGDLNDLIGFPLTMAEVKTSNELQNWENTEGYREASFTWTFYKFATIRGYVTIRWYGSSNGYYSEQVDFAKVLD